MSTAPIRIGITADDQYSAALSTAQARVRAFGATSGLAGESIRKSFHEARGSVDILSDTIGVKLSRELKGVLAHAQGLAPLLSAAFPIVAAIGFYEVIEKVGKAFGDWYYGADALKELGESMKTTTEYLVKLSAEVDHFNQQTAEVGVSAQQKWATALDVATTKLAAQNERTRRLSDTIFALQNGQQNAFGNTGSINGNTAADLPALRGFYATATADAAKFYAEQQHAQAELNAAQRTGVQDYAKALEAAAKKIQDARDKEFADLQKQVARYGLGYPGQGSRNQSFANYLAPGVTPGGQGSNPLASAAQIDPAIADKYLARFKAIQSVYEATRKPAEMLAIEIERLNALFGDNRGEIYQRSLAGIKARYDAITRATIEFGRASGDALRQGILLGGSWGDVFKQLALRMTELIIRMTLLKKLEDSFGEGGSGGGWGGFLTAVVGAFTGGHAGGGFMAPGQWGIVGENGPELAFAGSAGMSVYPNRSMGGGGNVYNIDARGAEVGVEQKILAAMKVAENRAVARSVGIIRENGLRGRG